MFDSMIGFPSEVPVEVIRSRGACLTPSGYRRISLLPRTTISVRQYASVFGQGGEIGEDAYSEGSKNVFIRTSDLGIGAFADLANAQGCLELGSGTEPRPGDILIAKDGGSSGLGRTGIYRPDGPGRAYLSAHLLWVRFARSSDRLFTFFFLKSGHFRAFVDSSTPSSSILKHSKHVALDYVVPVRSSFPHCANLSRVSLTLLSIDAEIAKRNSDIDKTIAAYARFNASAIRPDVSKAEIVASKHRFSASLSNQIVDSVNAFARLCPEGSCDLPNVLDIRRGQNLQVSTIGESVYADTLSIHGGQHPYRLVVSRDIGANRVLKGYSYLYNEKSLSCVQEDEFFLSARGELGRVFAHFGDMKHVITNIDSLVLRKKDGSSFIAEMLYLNHLAKIGYLGSIAITGSGANSLTKGHLENIRMPRFPRFVRAKLEAAYRPEGVPADFSPPWQIRRATIKGMGLWQLQVYRRKVMSFIDLYVKELVEGRGELNTAWDTAEFFP